MGKSDKSKYGQFNTGIDECKFTLNEIKKHIDLSGNILEPSFGTGNFVNELKKESNVSIDAVEIDSKVYKPIDGVNTINDDFVSHTFDKKYDFIIGNPPYIELTYSFYTKEQVKQFNKQNKDKGRGRINLIHLFFDKSFELLNDNGVIAFLLPTTILTSPWYNDIREKIYNEYTVLDIINKVPFKGVAVNVCLIIIQKKVDNNHQYIQKNNSFYFLSKNNITGLSTLKDKGFKCFVGDVLWYRVKDDLNDDSNNKTLVYTNNLKNNKLDFTIKLKSRIEGKKQYISNYTGTIIKNCIITPRVVSKKMKHCLILNNNKLVFENHIIVITHDDIEMLKDLNEVITNNIEAFSQYFVSSNISTTELLNYTY